MSAVPRVGIAALGIAVAIGCRRAPPANAANDGGPTGWTGPSAIVRRDAAADRCRVENGRMPWLVRWTADERRALADALREGLVIVAADDCRGLRVLRGCHAHGGYGYLGTAPTTRSADLVTDEELLVNAPLAGATSDAGSATPLHAAVTTVGRWQTVRALLAPDELTGACDGATHYVAYGAVGVPSATVDACAAAKPGDTAPPNGCDAPVVLRMEPIAQLGDLTSFDKLPSDAVAPIGMCPDGMVVTAEKCARKPTDAPYLCAFGDGAECTAQCDRGDINSCDVLASMLRQGSGVAKDARAAAARYAAACDRADAIACSNLASERYAGDGVAKDMAVAAKLFARACDLGEVFGCGNAATMRVRGEGSAKDAVAGEALRARACQAGSAESCEQIAKALAANDGARSRAKFQELCDVDDAPACAELGRIAFFGEGNTAVDQAAAARFFERACRAGDDGSCVTLGLQYRQATGIAQDDERATRLFRFACDHGSPDGCATLGVAYEHGKAVPRDLARAAQLYDRACVRGNGMACIYLADFAREGTGVARDQERAKKLAARACELGEKQACVKQPSMALP
jgi:TPR repeat protein